MRRGWRGEDGGEEGGFHSANESNEYRLLLRKAFLSAPWEANIVSETWYVF